MASLSIAQPDVTLHLDTEGVILEAKLSDAIPEVSVENWLGRPWGETVADVGGDKVKRMVEDACATGVSAFRQINQKFPSGLELPIEYATVRLSDKSGLVAIGRNLQAVAELQSRLISAQQAMERDYWKLRDIETRYRLLFDSSNDAVLLVRASNLNVIEANPAAIRALGFTPIGQNLVSELSPQEQDQFKAMVEHVQERGKAPALLLHFGQNREPWLVRASLMTAQPSQIFMIQLTPVDGRRLSNGRDAGFSTESFVDRLPDGVVVIDSSGEVKRANRAFLDLVQVSVEHLAVGEHIGRWLERPGADAKVLVSNVRKNGLVRLFSTTLRGELGTRTEVEISAIGNADSDPTYFGFIVRDIGHRLPGPTTNNRLGATLEPLAGQIGKRSLRDLVTETVGAVERHYIESALELTSGNRKAAAELLGLSRQSLYTKLNRYNLDEAPKKALE